MIFLNKTYAEIDYNEIEIYSYNRGELLSNYLNTLELEKNQLIKEIEIEADFDRALALNKRVKYIEKYRPLLDELIHEESKLHPTAKLLIKLSKGHSLAKELDEIFHSEIIDPISSRCTEELRDGIIFKKDGEIKEVFSICFSCATIKSKNLGEIYGDEEFYESYKKILLSIGQDVDEI